MHVAGPELSGAGDLTANIVNNGATARPGSTVGRLREGAATGQMISERCDRITAIVAELREGRPHNGGLPGQRR